MKKKKNFVWNIFFALVFLAGAGVFLYPTVSDMWNQYRNARLVSRYDEAVTDLSDNEYQKLWNEAKEYNTEHPVNSIVDAFGEKDDYVLSQPYDQILDPNGAGLMGSIEIPKINAKLAIYHGLSKTVLEKGVGHVEGTSLPVGGKSTHAVLAAHRGLPSAKLFTDLDQMKKGDIFILHILGKNLAYKVDQIRTVLPEETGELDIVEGEDHVTLVTCTPYGVNSHRLIVTGERISDAEVEKVDVPMQTADWNGSAWMRAYLKAILLGSAMMVGVIVAVKGLPALWKKGCKKC